MSARKPAGERPDVEMRPTDAAGADASPYAIVGVASVVAVAVLFALVGRLRGGGIPWSILISISIIVSAIASLVLRTGRARHALKWFGAGVVIGLGLVAVIMTSRG